MKIRPPESDGKHLALATIDDGVRAVSIRTLGAYAESRGVRTTLLMIIKSLASFDHPVQFSSAEIRQVAAFLRTEQVTHLGFYLMTASLKPYVLLVRALRAEGFTGIIMAGGVHVSLCPEESLPEGADFAVQGPGEIPLGLILDGANPADIPGLVWRKEGRIVINTQSPVQKTDLDALPFPILRFNRDWVLLDGKLTKHTWAVHRRHAGWHGRYYDLVTSRGCVYRCAYCCNVNGAPVRRASVDHVIGELKHLRESVPEIRGINIQDDSFYAGSEAWVKEFCDRLPAEVGLPFIIRMIPKYVTPARLEMFKSAGLEYVTMGLEASDRVNRQLFNRPETAASFIQAAKTVLEAGLVLSIDLIVNNPYETEADLREIAETLNALPRPNWWLVSLSLTPFPGTPLHKRCVKDKMLDQFATDAYDAMLVPSRPGGYRTPRFWLLLNTVVLPRVSAEVGARLIALGPDNPSAVRYVETLSSTIRRTSRITSWLRDETPVLYGLLFRGLRSLMKRKPLPRGVKVVH
jgi:radical SAM superfamily enzyme YgiQ (UPF0313 family)